MFPVSSDVVFCLLMRAAFGAECRSIARWNLKKSDVNKNLAALCAASFLFYTNVKVFNHGTSPQDGKAVREATLFWEPLILTFGYHERQWGGFYRLHHPTQSEHKVWTRRMEFNVPKASWQEMSRRDMHLQRESHRRGFVGKFLCNGSSLSGLAASSWASTSKTPEEENLSILSI